VRVAGTGLLTEPVSKEGKQGEVPEWPKGADCKSAGDAFEGSNPSLSTIFCCGNSSVGRAQAFQAWGRGFESRFPLQFCIATGAAYVPNCSRDDGEGHRCHGPSTYAQVAQSVEHVLGKDEVGGSIPLLGFVASRRWDSMNFFEFD
jgi:hypothetical protein